MTTLEGASIIHKTTWEKHVQTRLKACQTNKLTECKDDLSYKLILKELIVTIVSIRILCSRMNLDHDPLWVHMCTLKPYLYFSQQHGKGPHTKGYTLH